MFGLKCVGVVWRIGVVGVKDKIFCVVGIKKRREIGCLVIWNL